MLCGAACSSLPALPFLASPSPPTHPIAHPTPASARCLLQVQPDDPRLSRWTLSTYQFNRQWEFSWMALNMTPLRNQKIHWRSVPGSVGGSLGSALEVQNRWERGGRQACGWSALHVASLAGWEAVLTGLARPSLPRRGQIRFLRKGPQRCTVKLTISYEVPSAMAPFASVGASRGAGRAGRTSAKGRRCSQLLQLLTQRRPLCVEATSPPTLAPSTFACSC
jgi:hypothetical protein